MTLKVQAVSQLRRKGWSSARIAQRYGVTPGTVQNFVHRRHLGRWDVRDLVMLRELAAECRVTVKAILHHQEKLGFNVINLAGRVFMVTHGDAALIRSEFGIPAPDAYPGWLTAHQAAAFMGIPRNTLCLAVARGTSWARGVERVEVRDLHRRFYLYNPALLTDAMKLKARTGRKRKR